MYAPPIMKSLIEDNDLNPPGERLHTQFFTISEATAAPVAATRIYFPHLPILETGQIVGLIALSAFAGPDGNAPNVSPNVTFPMPSQSVSSFNFLTALFVTLVNKQGETLFDRIPYSTLFPFNGKIKRYNAVNLDTRKCFFTFPSGTIVSGNITAALGFYLNYQNKK